MLMLSSFYDECNIKLMKKSLLPCVTEQKITKKGLPTALNCCVTYSKAINHCKFNKTCIVKCNCPMMIPQDPQSEVNLQWKATQLSYL